MPGLLSAFGPAVALLSRQRFVGKLSVVGVLFLLPLAIALGFIAAHISSALALCRHEQQGIAFERRLFDLEEAVIRYARGGGSIGEIDSLIDELDRAETSTHAAYLPTGDWNEVDRTWRAVRLTTGGAASQKSALLKLSLIVAICAHVAANQSELISSPHSGIAFLSDSLAMQTRLVDHIGTCAVTPPQNAVEASSSVTEIEGASRAFESAVKGAVDNNPSLDKALDQPTALLTARTSTFLEALPPSSVPNRLDAPAAGVLDASANYYAAAEAAVGRIIDGREAMLLRQSRILAATSTASILLAIYFLIGLYLGTVSSVSELAGKARRLTSGEKLDSLEVAGRDEIAAVGTQALREIQRNLAEVKSLRSEIEERERVEAALRDSETRYRRLFEGNRTIQLLIDPETDNIVDANSAACAFIGYTVDELRGMHVSKIDGNPIEEIESDKEKIVAGEIVELTRTMRRADGELRQVEVHPTMVEVDARILVHAIITDVSARYRAISEKKIAEAKYEKIFENAIEGIFQSTSSGRFLSANPALARIYGYESATELVDAIVDIDRQLYVDPARRRELNERAEREGSVTEFESEVYRKDGSIVWITENVRAVRDENGKLLHYEGTVEDVTERRRLEQQREEMLKDAVDRADRDPLTGFYNHRSFHRKLHEQAELAQSNGSNVAIVVIDLDNFKFFNDAYGHLAGDEVLDLVAKTLNKACRPGDIIARFGGDEFALILPGVNSESLQKIVDALAKEVAGLGYRAPGYDVPIPLSVSIGTAVFPDEATDRMQALELADRRMLRSKQGGAEEEELERLRWTMSKSLAGFSMLDALVTAVDNKDRYTCRHSEDVLTYSIEIARELGLDDRTLHDIRVAALLHDVGKIGVPDYILRKPAKLTDDEFEAIKQHPMMGAVIVAAVPGLEHTLDAVRHHHERWDGEGYPWGLRGDEIPLMARIMAVADAFSAMTTDRPYRKGMPQERALEILHDGAGTQWDPECVDAFLRAHSVLPRIAKQQYTFRSTPLTDVYHASAA